MKALWANEAAEYHGIYYNFPPVRSLPEVLAALEQTARQAL